MNLLENYTIVLKPDDNGTYIAYIPAIEGCHAWGKTPEEARLELVNVFDMIREEYLEEKKSLPSDINLIIAHAI
jgi:predicted RNase H-like HicB family nuclease